MASVCVVCCDLFSRRTGSDGSEFHGKLEQRLSNYLTVKSNSLEGLLCANCVASVVSLCEKREEVNGAEESVRRIQLEILRMQREVVKMLGQLGEKKMELTHGLGKMEGVVEGSKWRIRSLDDFYGEDASGRVKVAIQVRETILNVFKDITSLLQTDVRNSEPQIGSPSTCHSPDFMDYPENEGNLEEEKDGVTPPSRKSTGRREQFTGIKNFIPNIRGMSTFKLSLITRTIRRHRKQQQGKPSIYPNVECLKTHHLTYDPTRDTLNLAGFQLTISNQEGDHCVTCGECGYQCRASPKSPRDIDRIIYSHVLGFHLKLFRCPHCPKSLNEVSTFSIHLREHESGKTLIKTGSEPGTKSKTLKRVKRKPLPVSKRKVSIPPVPKSQLIKKRVIKKLRTLPTLDLDPSMSSFKKAVVTRIIARQSRRKTVLPKKPESLEPGANSDLDRLNSHTNITYNATTDSLNISGFQLTISNTANVVQCCQCDFQFESISPYDIPRKIYNHVLGFHLELFRCSKCFKIMEDVQTYRSHLVAGCLRQKRCQCDICGKVLKSPASLRRHKWLHLSVEEKREAIQNGVKPPPKPIKKVEKCFQCPECGKAFATLRYLQNHEKIHQDPEYQCAECGKQFKDRSTLFQHEKFVCYPGKKDGVSKEHLYRFECDICLKKCRSVARLKAHKVQVHSKDRIFPCGVCGKEYANQGSRLRHERETHPENFGKMKPAPCKKGCGAVFKLRRIANRHEKKCTHGTI